MNTLEKNITLKKAPKFIKHKVGGNNKVHNKDKFLTPEAKKDNTREPTK